MSTYHPTSRELTAYSADALRDYHLQVYKASIDTDDPKVADALRARKNLIEALLADWDHTSVLYNTEA
jgi:MoaA/NifB/PqqE/SkfB family radical SAM enzyme